MSRPLLFVCAGLCLLPPLLFGVQFALFLRTPLQPARAATLTIPSGATLAQTARLLEQAGVVGNDLNFRLLGRFTGAGERLKAGRYLFSEADLPAHVLQRLVAGDVLRHRITIPEGFNVREVAARFEAAGLAPADALIRLAADPAFIAAQGLDVPTLEGFLFPETYAFADGLPPRKLLETMVRQGKQQLTPELVAAAAAAGLDRLQLVTLASIVQKEAGNLAEMPLIASVFHNRLRRKMPLQADPTVIYGIADFNGNLTKRDLQTYTPYNTYRIAGLPPGPITNPGSDALRAAARPASTNYLYFVARGDGSHAFSATLQEHNQAVRRYQLRH